MHITISTKSLLLILLISTALLLIYIFGLKRSGQSDTSYRQTNQIKSAWPDSKKRITALPEVIQSGRNVNMCKIKNDINTYFNDQRIIKNFFVDFDEHGNIVYPGTTDDMVILCQALSNLAFRHIKSKNYKSAKQVLATLIFICNKTVNIPVPEVKGKSKALTQFKLLNSSMIISNALNDFIRILTKIKSLHPLRLKLSKAWVTAINTRSLIVKQSERYSLLYKKDLTSGIITEKMGDAMERRIIDLKPNISQLQELTSSYLSHCN